MQHYLNRFFGLLTSIFNPEPTTNNNKPWTQESKQELLDLYANGMSDDEIATYMQRSKSAIYQKRIKLLKRKS